MTIGLPRALPYYRCGGLWRAFFLELGCDVVESGESSRGLLSDGARHTVDENCLPLKLYMGHIRSLVGRCDYILAPRLKSFGKNEELCVHFHGLYDLARSVCGGARLLEYNLDAAKGRGELSAFLRMGLFLERDPARVLRAYRRAKLRQRAREARARAAQAAAAAAPGLKLLIAGQSYISRDPYLSGPLLRMLREQGGVPLFSDGCGCAGQARALSSDLYWTLNKETVGAVAAQRARADGVLLLTAFPCGSDSLVNELLLRRVKDVPIVQIVLDEEQGEAGLQTRVESFLDILRERSRAHAR